ncbi:MAG: acyltransferase family protein, partial [Sodaliphilus sp.]|nr:acyltransferase family protein [Sodaliphilus sp.]MDY4462276.1 acyltransferase family protein [Sodaliphilus sp.]
MKTGSERQAWLDYVRFFSIFLVIVFHTPPRLELFDDAVILNLRVPVFFCISGFLYSFDRWPRFTTYLRHR